MVVRVRVSPDDEQQQEEPGQPAAKRPCTDVAAAGVACPDQFTNIKAHSVMLGARSDYFQTCLRGEWPEAAGRRVELTVPDEQAVEDLKLLIKLS